MDVAIVRLVTFLEGSRDEEDLIGMVKGLERDSGATKPRRYRDLIDKVLPAAPDHSAAKFEFLIWLRLCNETDYERRNTMVVAPRFIMLFDAVMWEVEGRLEAEAKLAEEALQKFKDRMGVPFPVNC